MRSPSNLATRPASALLMTLLVLIGISGIILTTSKLVLQTARIGSDQQDRQIAAQAADSGVQEGMIWLKNNGMSTASQVGQSLARNQKGFSGTDCATLSASADPGCPAYLLSVSPVIKVSAAGDTILGDSDLPSGTNVAFSVFAPLATSLQVNGSGVTIRCQAGSCAGTNYGNSSTISIPAGSSQMTLSRTSGSLSSTGITSASAGVQLTRLDYDCLESTGTSGNISITKRVRVLYNPDASVAGTTILEGSGCQDHLP